MGELLRRPEFGSIQSADIAPYYFKCIGGSLMVGRWTGDPSLFIRHPLKSEICWTYRCASDRIYSRLVGQYYRTKECIRTVLLCFLHSVMGSSFFMTQSKPVATLCYFLYLESLPC